eukprot:5806276-Pyramimonas_sp.AAC.1
MPLGVPDPSAVAQKRWKSTRPGKKLEWTEEDVKEVSDEIFEQMPMPAKKHINEKGLSGDIIAPFHSQTPDNLECGVAHVEKNYPFIIPCVAKFPTKIPSGFFLADSRGCCQTAVTPVGLA